MAHPDRLIRKALRRRYLITTADEATYDAILVDLDERFLVLADVQAVAKTGDRLPIDGQLWIPRSTVKYMQNTTA